MASSIRHPGVLWLHNDSGGGPYLYAVRTTDCAVVATLTLSGAPARDFEAIASGRDARGRATLWLGDIGDNRDSWPDVSVLAIREPARLGDAAVGFRTLRFTYPDMPHNAETLLAGRNGQLWVVTKQLANGGFYALPQVWRKDVVVAKRVGSAGPLITDGAMSPDGKHFVLRDYVDVRVFDGDPPGMNVTKTSLPAQVQGEAITWSADGRSLFLASEADDRLLEVPAPIALGASPDMSSSTPERDSSTPSSAGSAPSGQESIGQLRAPWLMVAVLLALGVAIIMTERWRRRSRSRNRWVPEQPSQEG